MAPVSTRNKGRDATPDIAFLNPDTAISGLRSGFAGTITEALYEQWDFHGKAKPKKSGKSGVTMAIHIIIDDIDDGSANPKPEDVYYPLGAIEDFVPSDDGKSFEAITGRKGFFRDMEGMQFIGSVLETGAVEKSELGIDLDIFVDKRFYWDRKPPLWADPKNPDHGKFSVLVPTKFVEVDEKPAKGNGKAGAARPAASTKAAAAAADDDDDNDTSALYDQAESLVVEVLGDLPKGEDSISRAELGSEVIALSMQKYKKTIDKDTRNAIGELFENDEFLTERAGKKTWAYSPRKGIVTAV